MKNHIVTITLGIVSILSGCIPTLNPIYTEKDLVFESELLGTWTKSKPKEIWTFDQKSETEYLLTYSKKRKHITFKAHLLKIGESLYLDLYPESPQSDDYFNHMHLYPVHTFYKIEMTNDQLTIKALDYSWLEKGIDANQINISHIKSLDGRILLTATTEELQKFILKYTDSKEAYKDSSSYKKK